MLKIKNLSIGYDASTVASNLNFEINKGDFVCIIGKNGVGKTTLIKTILGLLPPISGEVLFSEPQSLRTSYLPQKSQTPSYLNATVLEVILTAFSAERLFYGREEKERAKKALEMMDSSELLQKSYRSLSVGQQKRVDIAKAIVGNPDLLILDEPQAGLDKEAQRQFFQTLRNLKETNPLLTILVITHEDIFIEGIKIKEMKLLHS